MAPVRTCLRKEPRTASNTTKKSSSLKLKADCQLDGVVPSDAGYTGRPKKAHSGAMADICAPVMKLPTQGKVYMPKTTTIDHTSVLQAALVGYEMQRSRIEAAIAEIQAELGQGGARPSTATATASAEPKTPRKKRFSRAARKRMALAQKKRWAELKAKKAGAAKPKHKTAAKRWKANVAAPRKQRPVQVKAAKKVARKVVMKATPKPKAKKPAPAVRKTVAQSKVQELVTPVQVAVEPAPTEATV